MFEKLIQLENIQVKVLPSKDVPTRWNSTYLMLKSLLPYKEDFKNLAMEDANFTTCPTVLDWEEIEAMKDFFEIFQEGMFNFLFPSSYPQFYFIQLIGAHRLIFNIYIVTLILGKTHRPTAHQVYINMKNFD